MPTRLGVLLQRRKSAAAEPFHRHATASASAGNRLRAARAERGVERVESIAGMQRSYIKLLKISRGGRGTVSAGTAIFAAMAAKFHPSIVPFCAAMWQNL